MTPLFRTIAIATLSALLAATPVEIDAQHRSGRGGHHSSQSAPSRSSQGSSSRSSQRSTSHSSSHNTSRSTSRSNSNGNYRPGGTATGSTSGRKQDATPAGGSSYRPGNSGGNDNRQPGYRPNNPGNHNGNSGNHNGGGNSYRPNNPGNHNGNVGNRPGGNSYRPGGQPNHGHGPVAGPGPAPRYHAPAPGPAPRYHAPSHAPRRPAPTMARYRPVAAPWHRPVPPPSWRPRPSAPLLSAILGITFGTALNISVNALINSGYIVDSYANDVVYLREVDTYGYLWPYATLYYGSTGMNRSEFLYSTVYPDHVRFYSLLDNFNGIYGDPVDYVGSGASLSATWFAPNQGYVTLQYAQRATVGGQLRYFTTLTLGL